MRLGWKCDTVEDVGDGVVLCSQQGDQIRADIVIGCDGVHSVVRKAMPGQGSPRYQGVTTWRAVVSGDHHVGEPWLGIGEGKQIVASPLHDGRAYWSPMLRMEPGANASLADPIGFLLRAFARWHEPIPRLISMTDPANLIRSDVYDRLPTRLASGRVALAGDAAHPMNPALGQGACQAIVDAAVLGATWGRHPNPRDALRTFEHIRLKDVRRVVRDARRVNRICSSPSRLMSLVVQAAAIALPTTFALSATARYGRRAVIDEYLDAAAASR
jgi:2-polyprenyl-6-methoxyphenol hydroxylase-like FAD-dependent oxidoreductase